MNKPEYIIVHHAGGSDANPLQDSSNFTFEQCNELHKARFNFISSLGYYVGYHYYIEKDGTVKQGRADTDEGAHTVGYNSKSIGICLAGNFDANLPTSEQVASLKTLINKKAEQYNIFKENIVPHRKFAVKTCYGVKLSDTWASDLLGSSESNTTKAIALLQEAIRLLN
jgi:N-acetylmuramoyl-L-alanine amidase